MKHSHMLALVLTAILVGCASKNIEYPRASMFPYAQQQKMQSTEHWNVLAEHEAKLIIEKLSNKPLIHVSCAAKSCGGFDKHSSPFAQAYGRLLTTHLVSNGANVAVDYESQAHIVEYSVQVVKHGDRDSLPFKPGTVVGAAATAFGIYKAVDKWGTPGLIVAPIAAAADYYLYAREETDTSDSEVLVTTTVTSGNRLEFSDSRIYYFNTGDAEHYTNKKPGLAVTDVE